MMTGLAREKISDSTFSDGMWNTQKADETPPVGLFDDHVDIGQCGPVRLSWGTVLADNGVDLCMCPATPLY